MKMNPVIEKELKIKMRGWKAPALITVYLAFLGLIVFVSYLTNKVQQNYGSGIFNPRMALEVYNILALVQFIVIMFITPAMTGGAISGERERQTLDLLLCTNLSPLSIVWGKVFASISHIILLMAASLPIMSTVFLFGGVSLPDLLLVFAFWVMTALLLASMGIFYSTVFRKNTVSTIITYVTLGLLVVGTGILFIISYYTAFIPAHLQPTASQFMGFFFSNPVYGFSSVMENSSTGIFFLDLFLRYGNMTRKLPSIGSFEIKPWMVNMLFDLVLSAIFILLAARRIMPVKKPLFRRKAVKS